MVRLSVVVFAGLVALVALSVTSMGHAADRSGKQGSRCGAAPYSDRAIDVANLCGFDWRTITKIATNSTKPAGTQFAAAPSGGTAPVSPWRFEAMFYAAIPVNITGTSTTSGVTSPIDLTLEDVFDLGVFALAGRFEAWYNPWDVGFIFDGQYVRIGQNFSPTFPPHLKIDIRQGIMDFAGSWKFASIPLGEPFAGSPVLGRRPEITFEAIAGLRYNVLRQEITPGGPLGVTLGDTQSWVEPMVGGRVVWNINGDTALHLRGDVSGFGIKGASDLTWNAIAFLDYRFTRNHSAQFGFKYYSLDYKTGSGMSAFGSRIKMPMIWMSYTYHFTSF